MIEIKRKILVIFVALMALAMLVTPIVAAKPMEMAPAVMQLDAKITDTKVVGENEISTRIIFGYFVSGPFEGVINREIKVESHLKTGKITVQNILYVTGAVVTINGRMAEGEFVIKMSGLLPKVLWTVLSSNLVDSDTGKSVNLHGQGDSIISYMGAPYNFDDTPFSPINYGIDNILFGQISLTP